MKKTILGLCIGLMIGLASNAFAVVGDKVEAIFAEFVFVVDGETKTLDAQPVVINGSSYLPVRNVANLLGKDVTYKADSRTIELNTPAEQVKEGGTVSKTPKTINDMDIGEVESRIFTLKMTIKNNEITIETSTDNDEINLLQAQIDQFNAELAELEAKKAELEAQQPLQE